MSKPRLRPHARSREKSVLQWHRDWVDWVPCLLFKVSQSARSWKAFLRLFTWVLPPGFLVVHVAPWWLLGPLHSCSPLSCRVLQPRHVMATILHRERERGKTSWDLTSIISSPSSIVVLYRFEVIGHLGERFQLLTDRTTLAMGKPQLLLHLQLTDKRNNLLIFPLPCSNQGCGSHRNRI